MLRDRGGKPRVPDIVKDKEEMEEFRKLEPWNRPNVVVSKITSLIEHHRRVGNLGERACLDVFRDCQVGVRRPRVTCPYIRSTYEAPLNRDMHVVHTVRRWLREP